ncbi:MAG: hypothetical protein HFH83_11125 [Lachnospiraceae bacterium]|jgi:hypothetical protein|nr:hypothetical protein [Lachnospiraceae bacterium]
MYVAVTGKELMNYEFSHKFIGSIHLRNVYGCEMATAKIQTVKEERQNRYKALIA